MVSDNEEKNYDPSVSIVRLNIKTLGIKKKKKTKSP